MGGGPLVTAARMVRYPEPAGAEDVQGVEEVIEALVGFGAAERRARRRSAGGWCPVVGRGRGPVRRGSGYDTQEGCQVPKSPARMSEVACTRTMRSIETALHEPASCRPQ